MILRVLNITAKEQELRSYRLINADYLLIDLIEDEYVTRLQGNVNFFYGDTEFYADEAEIYEEQKIARLIGNVQVFEDSLSLFADEVDYFRLTEELELRDDVFIQEDHADMTVRTFTSDRARYHREEQRLYTFENSIFIDERDSVKGMCNYLDYDLDSGYGFVTDEPVVVFMREDTLSVAAERIEFYRDFNRLAASFDVRTIYTLYPETDEESLETPYSAEADTTDRIKPVVYKINSDFLLFFLDDEYAVFIGQPYLHSNSADAKAERFYVYFKEEKINAATLENNSEIFFAIEEDGEKNSLITADLVELKFTSGNISSMDAFGNVDSRYIEDEGGDVIINEASSEGLSVIFNLNNEIENIIFNGNVKGLYKFPRRIISE